MLQVGGDWKHKAFIGRATANAPKRSLGARDICRGNLFSMPPMFDLSQVRTERFIRKNRPSVLVCQLRSQFSTDRRQKTKIKTSVAPRPTHKAMRGKKASSVSSDPCPHFMWSEVGHLSEKAFIVMPRQTPLSALWAHGTFAVAAWSPPPPFGGRLDDSLNLNRTRRAKVPLLMIACEKKCMLCMIKHEFGKLPIYIFT